MPSFFEQFDLAGKQPSMDGNRQTADPSTILQPRDPGILPTNITQPVNGGNAQDPEAFFNSLFPGDSLSPEQLAASEAQLQAAGWRLLGPNAAGQRTKVELPDGRIMDVIGGAGAGHNRKQFSDTGSGGGSPQVGGQPLGQIAGGAGTDNRLETLRNTPGYQFIMDEAMGALEKSAAARGTLLTGGHLKELQNRAGQIASTGFGQEFDRNLQLGQLGYNAASAQNASGSSYGGQITDLTTGAGNAQAAGTVGAGNAYNSALGGIGQNALDIWAINRRYPAGQQPPMSERY